MTTTSHPLRWFRAGRCLAALLLCVAAAAPSSQAEELVYLLEIPAGESVTYTLELPLRHAGVLELDAVWSGKRIVAFKLDQPEPAETYRRTGPSPQRISIPIPTSPRADDTWTLKVHSRAASEGGKATLKIRLPDPPAALQPDSAAVAEAPPEQPWMQRRDVPRSAPGSWHAVYSATEQFRQRVLEPARTSAGDACRWQQDLLHYTSRKLDELERDGWTTEEPTRRLLGRIAESIRNVEQLRTSNDPHLTGPPPADPGKRRRWERARREKLRDIQRQLDDLLNSLNRGHAPELARYEWPTRLASCVTACERHFEQRASFGEHAANRDLALAQWDRLVVAAELLAELARLE